MTNAQGMKEMNPNPEPETTKKQETGGAMLLERKNRQRTSNSGFRKEFGGGQGEAAGERQRDRRKELVIIKSAGRREVRQR